MGDAKPWYQSKTILANLTLLAVWVLTLAINAAQSGQLPSELAPYAIVIVLVGNLLLRLVTTQPVIATRRASLRSKLPLVFCGCLVPLGCSSQPQPATAKVVQVDVYRHRTVALTEAEADRILAQMSEVLTKVDRPGDVAAPITYRRRGTVKLLPTSVAAVIQTSRQFDQLVAAPPGVKVVRAINWCGGPGGSIIGCAPLGSPQINIGVVRFTASQEGGLWAHETGHNAGLDHRTNDRNAVMYPVIGTGNNVLTRTEAAAYLRGPGAATAATASPCPCQDAGDVPKPADIRVFAQLAWAHGIPRSMAEQYTPTEARRLLPYLVSADNIRLPGIVTTLCYAGGPEVIEPLLEFLEQPARSEAQRHGQRAAALHLGHLMTRTKNATAVPLLTRLASQPHVARAAVGNFGTVAPAVSGVDPPTVEELADELAIAAATGLSLTDRPEARAALEIVLHSSPSPTIRVLAAQH